ncbi:uncharacterized protein LOC106644661 [Copidosoma floridanum]|uniref:uncharacterized protein LOC106644661 n=1 Tax=Copidosoma floridanum TaxID=29053 RepID=UPI0006C98101|nr:uncharacterized protein LOC106644661 [Copidosoma floridanum]
MKGRLDGAALPEMVVRLLSGTTRGNAVAYIEAPASAAAVLDKMDYLRLGWVNCRSRPRIKAERCYRCLGFGHISHQCGWPDRTGACFRYQPRHWVCQVWSPTGGCRNSSEEMALILQVNLDRTVLAHDLLDQFSRARGVDLLFINEPSRTLLDRGRYCDRTRGAAILIRSEKISVSDTGGKDGQWLAELEDTVRVCRKSGDVVLAGDFNSKVIAWEEPRTDPRGRAVRPGNRGTIIDLMLVSSEMAARVSDWRVLEDYTVGYHQYVSFVIHEDRGANSRDVNRRRVNGWNVAKLNRDLLLEAMVGAPPPADLSKIKRRLRHSSARRGRRSCYWWNKDIANWRREAQHLWRLAQRHRTRQGAGAAAATYKVAKKALVDKDTWGLGYRIALKRLRGSDPTPPMEPSLLERVVSCLFPEHPTRRRENISVGQVPLFTLEELRSVASETPGHKAPGLDGVPSEVLKIIAVEKPHVMLDMFNACLHVGLFSRR